MKTIEDVSVVLLKNYPELPYGQRGKILKKTISWGQRKLLLIEIEFLTLVWHSYPHSPTLSNPILIYAGAAPGTHLPILSLLFPMFIFHLFDPRPFEIQETEKIHIHQIFFTDEIALYWQKFQKENQNVFFISDIRSVGIPKESLVPKESKEYQNQNLEKRKRIVKDYEDKIWQDMLNQEKWTKIIQPCFALLKFRLPYGKDHRNPTDYMDSHVNYLNGLVLPQPYAKRTSSETRLIPFSSLKNRVWNVFSYENQLFHFNTIDRETKNFTFHTCAKCVNKKYDLSNDHDSAHEYRILKEYLDCIRNKINKINNDECNQHQQVNMLSNLITSCLSRKKSLSKLRGYLDVANATLN